METIFRQENPEEGIDQIPQEYTNYLKEAVQAVSQYKLGKELYPKGYPQRKLLQRELLDNLSSSVKVTIGKMFDEASAIKTDLLENVGSQDQMDHINRLIIQALLTNVYLTTLNMNERSYINFSYSSFFQDKSDLHPFSRNKIRVTVQNPDNPEESVDLFSGLDNLAQDVSKTRSVESYKSGEDMLKLILRAKIEREPESDFDFIWRTSGEIMTIRDYFIDNKSNISFEERVRLNEVCNKLESQLLYYWAKNKREDTPSPFIHIGDKIVQFIDKDGKKILADMEIIVNKKNGTPHIFTINDRGPLKGVAAERFTEAVGIEREFPDFKHFLIIDKTTGESIVIEDRYEYR